MKNDKDRVTLEAELALHEEQLKAEREARIARQNEPEHFIPDPAQPELPFNQNSVSDFEYNYGEIAFYGGVLFLIVLCLVILYSYMPPV